MAAPQQYPDAVEELIGLLRLLPGIGRRGAERLVLSLLNWEPEKLRLFGKLVGGLPESRLQTDGRSFGGTNRLIFWKMTGWKMTGWKMTGWREWI